MQLNSNEYSDEVVRSYENKLTKVKKPSKLKGIELFSKENNNDETSTDN
jgi:hypothetical protein